MTYLVIDEDTNMIKATFNVLEDAYLYCSLYGKTGQLWTIHDDSKRTI